MSEKVDGTADIEEWPTAAEAAAEVGISPAALRGHARRGRITPQKDRRGRLRIKPEELEELAEHVSCAEEAVLGQDDDADPNAEIGAKDLLAASAKIIHDATEHTRKMMELITVPLKVIAERQAVQLDHYAKRTAELEASRDEMLRRHEERLNEEHTRQLAASIVEGQEKRKSDAMQLILARAPGVIDAIKDSAIGADPRVRAVLQLFDTLDPTKLQALLSSGFLSDAEADLVREIIKVQPPPAADETQAPKQGEGWTSTPSEADGGEERDDEDDPPDEAAVVDAPIATGGVRRQANGAPVEDEPKVAGDPTKWDRGSA